MVTGNLTEAERERREALSSQPHAVVLDLLHVQCKRCGGRIKLSQSTLYDPQHWWQHRERCDKWSDEYVAARLEKHAMVSAFPQASSMHADALLL